MDEVIYMADEYEQPKLANKLLFLGIALIVLPLIVIAVSIATGFEPGILFMLIFVVIGVLSLYLAIDLRKPDGKYTVKTVNGKLSISKREEGVEYGKVESIYNDSVAKRKANKFDPEAEERALERRAYEYIEKMKGSKKKKDGNN